MRLSPGHLLARVTALPVLALAAWLLVTFPLLLAGQFTPIVALITAGPVVVAAIAFLPRWVPAPRPPGGDDAKDSWWPLIAIVVIVVAFALVEIAYHSEQIVVRRDAASYSQFTTWIAQHGSLPIPQQRDLIAGDLTGLSYDSPAFYQVGDVIWPQFLSGAPLILSVGYWINGVPGMLVTAPLLGALGVLTFAGLAARLLGARWAVLATLVLAVCLPQQWVSRSTYSEPAAQILLLGALLLAYDALARRPDRRQPTLWQSWNTTHLLALAAGLAFGLGLVARIDALRDILPVVAFIGLLLLARRGQALPMLAGLLLGAGYGFVAGFWLSQPYMEHLSGSLQPLLLISAVAVVAVGVATAVLWRRGIPRVDRSRWLPTAVAVVAVVAMAGFALRPLIYVQHGHADELTAYYIGQVQEIEGVPIDPSRTYEEMTLYWVGWYLGLATVLFASIGVALLLRRVMLRRDTEWVLPLLVFTWTVATTLARPAITPDHPWASRRLVVLVLPAFILLAVWFLAWFTRRLRSGPTASPTWFTAPLMSVAALILLVPTALTASGVMSYRMDVGSVAATEQLCDEMPPDASALILDGATSAKFMQVIRGMCGVPTAHVKQPDSPVLDRAISEIHQRGRRAVLVADRAEKLTPHLPAGVDPAHPFNVRTEKDPSTLMKPPQGPWIFDTDVWVAVVPQP
ncbi:hypothetical protein [Salinactinospora qingdaonensis]|uniref:hypothetical protein n=1 Tax=Salinactinospora qingdaonensis TaxID=702744 RepID=UPI0031EF6ACD